MRGLLATHGLQPDKGFGQNFLVDARALADIVDAAGITADDTVLEVGPGLGVLTRELAARARHVVTVELDRRLEPVLRDTLAGLPNVTVIFQDAVTFDSTTLPPGSLLVANLPYNVATRIVSRALSAGRFRRLVFLVQREVAERLTAGPDTKAYGALTLKVAHFGRARIMRQLTPGCFLPPPDVTSSLVRIDIDAAAGPAPELFTLIHAAFRHRRKTLKKNLLLAGFDTDTVLQALLATGLDPRVRAEALDLATFRALLPYVQSGIQPGRLD